jgi:hypothetical protein
LNPKDVLYKKLMLSLTRLSGLFRNTHNKILPFC